MLAISVPSGTSGSGTVSGFGGAAAADLGWAGWRACFAAGSSGAAGGADSSPFCCCAGLADCPSVFDAGSSLPAPDEAPLIADASSPSLSIMAIGVLTATSLVPSGTRILPSVPSSTASTSMVALSVSISAITSPDLTVSPSFFSHLARLPFSIVGDSAGINTGVGMGLRLCGLRLGVNVGVELGRIGLGVLRRELGRLVDHGAHFGIDLLQCILAGCLLRQQARTHLLDRITLGAHLVDFFLGTIFGRVGHGVTAITISHHLQDHRPLASAAPIDRLLACRPNGPHIHSVDLFARDVKGAA